MARGDGGDRGANHTFLCNTAAVWREGRAVKMSDGRQMPVHDVISPLPVLREQLQKMLVANQCNMRCLSSQALMHFEEVFRDS